MPREISDIKNVGFSPSMRECAIVVLCLGQLKLIFWQFIEICRRKDASCTFPRAEKSPLKNFGRQLRGGFKIRGRIRILRKLRLMENNSCPHKAHQEVFPDQVQGPLPTPPLHSRLEGCRKGREVEAIAATQYVFFTCAYLPP